MVIVIVIVMVFVVIIVMTNGIGFLINTLIVSGSNGWYYFRTTHGK